VGFVATVFLLFALTLGVYVVALPFMAIARGRTKRAMYAEASRLATAERKAHGAGPRQGYAWESEKARLIDDVIAPKFGGAGRQLARVADVRQRLEELLEGEDGGTRDWTSDPSRPRAGSHSYGARSESREYAGRSYVLHTDGCILCEVDGQDLTWRSEDGFKQWADRNPPLISHQASGHTTIA